MKELYSEHANAVLMLGDVLNIEECEIEDVLGEDVLIPAAKSVLGDTLELNDGDRAKGSLVDQIKSAAKRQGIELADGWKPQIARRLVGSVVEYPIREYAEGHDGACGGFV